MAPTSDNHNHEARKRVPKACDRCRLKKVKCDGNMPCPRCKMEDAVCHFGARRKSIERPVSAGYVDQIETQQRILIKALREMWVRYAPKEMRTQTGKEPSVHSMVRLLGVLKESSDHEAASADFHFNESLTTNLSEASFGEDFSFDSKPPYSSCSSVASPTNRLPSLSNNESSSTTSSRAPSEAAAVQSAIFNQLPHPAAMPKTKTTTTTEASRPAIVSRKTSKPTFCPLPPRPINTPVKPMPLYIPQAPHFSKQELSTDSAISMTSIKDEAEDPVWPTMDPMHMHNGFTTPFVPMDFGSAPPGPVDESWSAWIDDHPEYAPLNPLAWSQYVPQGQ